MIVIAMIVIYEHCAFLFGWFAMILYNDDFKC